MQSKSNKAVAKSKPFDKYEYYHKSVQSPETDVEFFKATYEELKGKKPVAFREDFCGTFAISCEWVKLHKSHRAIGVDLDPEPIEYGKQNYFSKLTPDQRQRLQVLQANVLDPHLPLSDIVGALNFSYFIFKTRDQMRRYFTNAYTTLNRDGIMILDLFGGQACYDENEEPTKHPRHTYYWHQSSYDPITHEAFFHIHFKVKGEKKRESVFTYDWRMWGIPELRELLEEVGFKKTHVYWEGTDRKGNGNGVFTRAEKGECCAAWIAYIVAEK